MEWPATYMHGTLNMNLPYRWATQQRLVVIESSVGFPLLTYYNIRRQIFAI